MTIKEKLNELIDLMEFLVCVTDGISQRDSEHILEVLYELKEEDW